MFYDEKKINYIMLFLLELQKMRTQQFDAAVCDTIKLISATCLFRFVERKKSCVLK